MVSSRQDFLFLFLLIFHFYMQMRHLLKTYRFVLAMHWKNRDIPSLHEHTAGERE